MQKILLIIHAAPYGSERCLSALRLALADHLFPAVQGPWRVGAIGFTLVLGSFAYVRARDSFTK